MTEEIKNKIEEIEKRISVLPDKMEMRDTKVPMKVKDPATGMTIDDPHGRLRQSRADVVATADPYQKPIIHFHQFPEHPVYEQNWQPYAEAFVHMKSDIQFLIEQLKEKP